MASTKTDGQEVIPSTLYTMLIKKCVGGDLPTPMGIVFHKILSQKFEILVAFFVVGKFGDDALDSRKAD